MTDTPQSTLKSGRLGVFGIVFFVVAASAPLIGITGAVPVAMLLGNGAAVPGAYLAVGITLLISADPGAPVGGGLFHDTAVWLRPA